MTEKNLKQILVISFPHKNHLNGLYEVNISNYIDEVFEKINDRRFSHLNFSKKIFTKKQVDSMYIEGDVASHLKDKYHSDLFLKNILEKIKN